MSRQALYGYLIGRKYNADPLPGLVKASSKRSNRGDRAKIPDVPFQMLTALELRAAEWTAIAKNASWQMTRMNLNTFARHGVFEDEAIGKMVANRLRDPAAVKRARVLAVSVADGIQIADQTVPAPVRERLQDAMEIAIQNVPPLKASVLCLPGCVRLDAIAGDRSLRAGRDHCNAVCRCGRAGGGISAAQESEHAGDPALSDNVVPWR